MPVPILEFDPAREAFIEPAKVIRPRGIPEHCVFCFFGEVIEKLVQEHGARVLVENRWEDGPHPVYELIVRGKPLAVCHPGIGAPLSAALLEEVIAFGARKFIACGGAGVLVKEIVLGHLVVVSSAVRDEGVSYHYLPPSREVASQPDAVQTLVKTLQKHNLPHQVGKTWTTDAPYRETPAKIAARRAEGCLVVEMEAAGLLAVAQFRQVLFGQVLYGGDDLSGEVWDSRGWQSKKEIRANLFWLSVEACLDL